MAKAPRPGAARKAAGETRDGDEGVKLRVVLEGETVELVMERISPADAIALRQALGIGPVALARRVFEEGTEIDTAAAIAWLARRQNGEQSLTFEAVAAELTLGSMLAPATADVSAEPHSPE